jgi:hypothetical protein
MLRSIIAIWTVALVLLVIAATSGCDNGCLSGDSGCGSYGVSVPDMARPPVAQCATQCDSCGAGEVCFQPDFAANLPSFCAVKCDDDRGCATGQKCATLFAAMQPSICIGAGNPRSCGGTSPSWSCDLQPAACKDAMTAQVAFSDATDQVCGWELVHCANGCANGACL